MTSAIEKKSARLIIPFYPELTKKQANKDGKVTLIKVSKNKQQAT